MNQEKQIVEPLAKFHAQVYRNGRIAIPANEREYFGLDKHDIVNLIIRKLDNNQISGRGQFWTQLTIHGRLTIPHGLRQQLNISEGDYVEVLLIGFIKLQEKLQEEEYHLFQAIKDGEYFILTSELEQRAIQDPYFLLKRK